MKLKKKNTSKKFTVCLQSISASKRGTPISYQRLKRKKEGK